MTKTYLATKQDIVTVNGSISTINSQINAADTGLNARITTIENNNGSVITKFKQFATNGVYESGEVVVFGGALFSANSAMNGTTVAIVFSEGSGADKWTRTGGSTPVGTVIHWEGVKYGLPVPDGYALCNGAVVNYVGSLLHGQATPDHRGFVLAAANGGTYTANTVAGIDSRVISQANLPNITLSGTTGTESQSHSHTTAGYTIAENTNSQYATNSATYSNVAAFSSVRTLVSDNGAALGGTTDNSYIALDGADRVLLNADTLHNHSMTVNVPSKTSGSASVTHTHTFTTSSLNSGVQSALDVRQATRYVTTLIKL